MKPYPTSACLSCRSSPALIDDSRAISRMTGRDDFLTDTIKLLKEILAELDAREFPLPAIKISEAIDLLVAAQKKDGLD